VEPRHSVNYLFPTIEKTFVSDERIFSGFGSVEVLDKQDDIIDIDGLTKIMGTVMERGGVIMDSHSNKHVGKILDWKVKDSKGLPGIWIKGKIFDDYSIDNEAWDKIKNNDYTGFSLGGRALKQDTFIEGGTFKNRISDIEVWEFSVVNEPANTPSKYDSINFLAKGDTSKAFAGYKDFDACVAGNQDTGNPEAYCAVIHHQATGKWPSEKMKDYWSKDTVKTKEDLRLKKLFKRILGEDDMGKDKKKQEGEEEETEEQVEVKIPMEVMEELVGRVEKLEAAQAKMAEDGADEEDEEEEEEKSKKEAEEEEEEEEDEEEEEKSKKKSEKKELDKIVEKSLKRLIKKGVLESSTTKKPKAGGDETLLRKSDKLDWKTLGEMSWQQLDGIAAGDD